MWDNILGKKGVRSPLLDANLFELLYKGFAKIAMLEK
jgi:hypothetical protein